MAGRWLPFDELNPNSRDYWVNKGQDAQGEFASSSHPLHRFGTAEFRQISHRLTAMDDLPRGIPVGSIHAVNQYPLFLSFPNNPRK